VYSITQLKKIKIKSPLPLVRSSGHAAAPAMCPGLAPAASFASFYNLIVLLYLSLQLLRHHGGAALFKSMAEQLC